MASSFNPDLLRMAREARGYSQVALHERSGISQGAISKIESGLIDPNEDFLQKLSDALSFPPSLFFENDRVVGLPVSVHPAYRKRASVGQKRLTQLEAEVNIRLMHIRRFLRALDFRGELEMPHMELDEFGSPAEIAELVRRTWLLPSGPVRNLVETVERAGCVVVHCDFDGRAVDGLTIRVPGLPPCIFINRNSPADRQRFTLAHEIGHIVMHRVPSHEMEKEADEFASALLMPARDISGSLTGGLSLARLGALKLHWRVSMAALVVRAGRLGAINEHQSRQVWVRTLSRYRKSEPPEFDFPVEQPQVLSEMVRYHTEDLGYSTEDVARFLHLYEKEASEIYGLNIKKQPHGLRIVR